MAKELSWNAERKQRELEEARLGLPAMKWSKSIPTHKLKGKTFIYFTFNLLKII